MASTFPIFTRQGCAKFWSGSPLHNRNRCGTTGSRALPSTRRFWLATSDRRPTTDARRTTMAKLNTLNLNFPPRTHEGAPARNISTEPQLRRSVMACLLWESQFYEDGVEIAGRIAELVPKVAAEKVAALAIEAREQMKLR